MYKRVKEDKKSHLLSNTPYDPGLPPKLLPLTLATLSVQEQRDQTNNVVINETTSRETIRAKV